VTHSRGSAMMPGPTTAASRSAVPSPSAVARLDRLASLCSPTSLSYALTA
jgi:hypothetical protein